MSAAIPLLEMANSLPQSMPRPEIPKPLECLEWEGRVEKWGLLNPGTWLDQPKWFMEDIRAAGRGQAQWRVGQRRQDTMDIPETAPGITR